MQLTCSVPFFRVCTKRWVMVPDIPSGDCRNWLGVVNSYCMQMSLVMGMPFLFSAMIEMMHYLHHILLLGNDVISLKSRPLIFVYLFTCTQSIRKQ